MTPVWEDERVVAGMRAQLERRDAAVAAGARLIGWKVGFGTAAAMTNLKTSGPLVGYLLDSGLLAPDSTWDVGGASTPAVEPEVALHLGADLAPGGDVAAAVAGVSPAFELVDLDTPMDDVEGMLAGDIFARHVVLAGRSPAVPGGLGVRPAVVHGAGPEPVSVADPQDTVGDFAGLLAHVAAYLDAFGERLEAGQFVITGSMIPLVKVSPGAALRLELEGAEPISVSVA
jgi:2-keto-4-pentenoate hydratase